MTYIEATVKIVKVGRPLIVVELMVLERTQNSDFNCGAVVLF